LTRIEKKYKRIIINFELKISQNSKNLFGGWIMPVIKTFEVKSVKIPAPFERVIRVLLAPDTQDIVKGMSVSHCIISSHSKTDYHKHPGVEMMYIITGYGECHIGKETFPLGPDVLMVVPPETMHDMINHSDETMKLVAMFIPPETAEQIYERAQKAAQK
jgi:mannose-6-phosphate isomerase-like protein (cupin superfamily)